MRPYASLILDSFREAFVSRTLLILLVPITLLLLVVAPFGVREDVATKLTVRDLTAPVKLLRMMRAEENESGAAPGKHLWSLLTEEERGEFEEILEGEQSDNRRFRNPFIIRRTLNRLIGLPEFYNADAWKSVELDNDTQELVDRDVASLGKIELQRRNRLLLEAAYPDLIASGGATVVVHYLGFDFTDPLPLGGRSVRKLIGDLIVPMISTILAGNIAVFVAILVTSPIIPQLFDPGSLSLLFSKPIVRSLAFLSKFGGGCAYILLCSAYLNVGIWLILGLRYGIWNAGWWTTIPVFLFLFAVYYSVSAAAGVIWRHPIVAIACATLFWLLGFGVAVTERIYFAWLIMPRQTMRIVESGGEQLAVTRGGEVRLATENSQQWETIDSGFGPTNAGMMGPLLLDTDEGRRVLFAWRMPWQGLFDQLELKVYSKTGGQWELAKGVLLPRGTIALLQTPKGDVVTVSRENIFRLNRFLADESDKGISTGFFLKLPRFGKPAAEPIGPTGWELHGPSAAAIDPQTGRIVVYDAGRVIVCVPTEEGGYEVLAERNVFESRGQGGAVAIGGDTVVSVVVDGDVVELDATTLKQRRVFRRESTSQPRSVVAVASGKAFAINYHNKTAYLLDPRVKSAEQAMRKPRWLPQRSIDAVGVDLDGKLRVVHDYRYVSVYDVEKEERVASRAAPMKMYEKVYFYVIAPIEWVIPQPGELKNTALYLISGEETLDGDINRPDIEAARESLSPWKPVISSGVFLVLMLGLTCLYIERQDY